MQTIDARSELERRLAELDTGGRRYYPPSTHPPEKPSSERAARLLLDFVEAIGAPDHCSSVCLGGTKPIYPKAPAGPRDDIAHIIEVLQRITNNSITDDANVLPCVSAADADALIKNGRLLNRLTDAVPEIAMGPLRLDSQYWIGTGNPSDRPKAELTLSESHFVAVAEATPVEVSTKPFYVGLFTATGVLGTYGMWRMYLDGGWEFTLHPLPWWTWAVEPHDDVVVHEIASASQWVDFVLSHPLRKDGLLFPDWHSVARRCDGVHMTLRAIAATQGLYFPTEQGIVAAPYWDVESTLWLRWRFRSVKLVDVVT
jgi:hypothetical protein